MSKPGLLIKSKNNKQKVVCPISQLIFNFIQSYGEFHKLKLSTWKHFLEQVIEKVISYFQK